MLSARGIYQEILDNDDSFRLFCSIAAGGEAQGGWENARIAALVPESQRELAPKVARHGADEDKHGRIFKALLGRRGLEPVPTPPETDYTMLLEKAGIGLRHSRLRRDEPLTERDLVSYLAHSRVTEQRASEQMAMLDRYFGDHPEIGRAVRMISGDEDNHLAYCHEELLRLAGQGHDRAIRSTLRRYALAEIRVYRDVSVAVMSHMGRILGWSRIRSAALRLGILTVYGYERLGGWRRAAGAWATPWGAAAGARRGAPCGRSWPPSCFSRSCKRDAGLRARQTVSPVEGMTGGRCHRAREVPNVPTAPSPWPPSSTARS